MLIVFAGNQYEFGDGAVGTSALAIANAKASLGFGQAVALGIMCNALVCLAIWLSYSARSVTDKILAVLFPISAFVAAGFEHSIANMYFLPIGPPGPRPGLGRVLRRQRRQPKRLPRPDARERDRRQPDPGDDRQHHRRLGDGRPRLLVDLRANEDREAVTGRAVTVALTVLGAACVLVALRDVFDTLFHPHGRAIVSRTLIRVVWRIARRVARRDHRLLSVAGPVAFLIVIGAWGTLVLVGFAFMILPQLPEGFSFDPGLDPAAQDGFEDALYVSMVNLVSLGTGDIVPTLDGFRLLCRSKP